MVLSLHLAQRPLVGCNGTHASSRPAQKIPSPRADYVEDYDEQNVPSRAVSPDKVTPLAAAAEAAVGQSNGTVKQSQAAQAAPQPGVKRKRAPIVVPDDAFGDASEQQDVVPNHDVSFLA